MKPHTTIRIEPADLASLRQIAKQHGFTRDASGERAPDVSAFVRAIARGELVVQRQRQPQPAAAPAAVAGPAAPVQDAEAGKE